MKIKNPYTKVLKERYLSLIVVPVVIIAGFFIYAHFYGIIIINDFGEYSIFGEESIVIEAFFAIILFLFIQIIKLLVSFMNQNLIKAFAITINLVILLITVVIGVKYSHFTQKVENFKNERQYYLRHVKLNQRMWSDHPQMAALAFDTFIRDQKECYVIYTKIDNYIDYIYSRHQNNNHLISVEDIVKLDSSFFYVCKPVNDQNNSIKISH